MSVTMGDRQADFARRGGVVALAVLVLWQAVACSGSGVGRTTMHDVVLGAAPPVPMRGKKTKPPKLGKSAEAFQNGAELEHYLKTDPGTGTRKPNFRADRVDFEDGIANEHDLDAVGGGTVKVVIVPEEGNFLLSTEPAQGDFPPQNGVVVARIENRGSKPDVITEIPAGETGYWFVERGPDGANGQPGDLQSLFVRAVDARVVKRRSFRVCHRRKDPTYPTWWVAAADFIDPKDCEPKGAGGGGTPREGSLQFGSSIALGAFGRRQALSVSWIPCNEGCCVGE